MNGPTTAADEDGALTALGIGGSHPPFVVAEIGANHDGSVEHAHRLVAMCAEAGAHAVKFQTYTAAELVSDGDRVLTWGPPGRRRSEPVATMFDRLSLPREAHGELFAHARELGMAAFSTPFSVDGVQFLAELDAPLMKVASSDVTHVRLLDAIADVGVPVILSTGKSTAEEVDAAVHRLRAQGVVDLVVLHCIAEYPAPAEDMNLRTMTTLADRHPGSLVGLSDHSIGIEAALGAVALGAALIEKHVTLDRSQDGPDHWFSADPPELAGLVQSTQLLHTMLGDGLERITAGEIGERATSTRSLVLRRPVSAGRVLVDDDLDALRPGHGISPLEWDAVLGRALREDAPTGTVLEWSMLQ